MKYVASTLRQKYSEDELVVLVVKSNAGNFTYDGIEVGAERCVTEVEERLEELARDGHHITKFSMVGYSLGGLVARYALGILHTRGWFEKIKPINFTTFATPHLGARSPMKGFGGRFWNYIGSRTLSVSGRQIFIVDTFRDTGRPLLSLLADPDSIFISALKRFKNRSLYANIVNDRTANYYTTAFSSTDPFTQINELDITYQEGYHNVILDPSAPVKLQTEKPIRTFNQRVSKRAETFSKTAPFYFFFTAFFPLFFTAFMINSTVQYFNSRRRIQLHEQNHVAGYRLPELTQKIQRAIQDTYENANAAQEPEYLPGQSEAATTKSGNDAKPVEPSKSSLANGAAHSAEFKGARKDSFQTGGDVENKQAQFPTLALVPEQFAMIRTLDDCGFRKYLVHIHKSNHSHAAIIVRRNMASFSDGKVVVDHWLQESFEI